jgi:hypothetical protein
MLAVFGGFVFRVGQRWIAAAAMIAKPFGMR